MSELKQTLEQEYNIKLFADIADVASNPYNLYSLLKSVYQEKYKNNDRIIFYTSYSISDDFIKYMYQATKDIDISNWFVNIVCCYDITEKLEKCKTNNVSFVCKCYDFEYTKPINYAFELPKTLCAVPWSNLEIFTNGDITPCCVSKHAVLGNIKDTDIQDAFYSERMNHIRSQFLAGEKPEECRNCWKTENKNLTSTRLHKNKILKEKMLTKYFKNPNVYSLDLKLGNACNFKCRICNPRFSSLFASEAHKHKDIPLVEHSKWQESDRFLSQLEQVLPQIENIDMTGGEPFLLKKITSVLKTAVEKGYSKKIRLHYNSNGSIYPIDFLSLWQHFKEVNVLFSIDNTGKRFELERGSNWQSVEENVLMLKNSNMSNLKVNIMPSVGIMNVYYLDELYNWAKKQNLDIFLGYVRSTDGLDLANLTKVAQDMIIEKYEKHPWKELRNMAEYIKKLPPSDGKLFCKTMKYFDKIRQQNFIDSHPEIAQAMGYSVK